MSWFAISAFVLLAVILCGFLLPQTYNGAAEKVISAPVERVWEAVNDPETAPIGGAMTRSVERLEDGWVEDLGSSRVTVTVSESTPPSRAVRELADDSLPMTAHNVVILEALPDGTTRARVEHSVTIRVGTWHVPIFRWIMLLTRGASSVPRSFLDDVNAKLVAAKDT